MSKIFYQAFPNCKDRSLEKLISPQKVAAGGLGSPHALLVPLTSLHVTCFTRRKTRDLEKCSRTEHVGPPPHSCMERLSPQGDGVWGRGLREVPRSRGQSPHERDSTLIKETQSAPSSPPLRGDAARIRPSATWSGPFDRHQMSTAVTLDFQPAGP